MNTTGHWSATFFVCYTGHERGKQGSLACININEVVKQMLLYHTILDGNKMHIHSLTHSQYSSVDI